MTTSRESRSHTSGAASRAPRQRRGLSLAKAAVWATALVLGISGCTGQAGASTPTTTSSSSKVTSTATSGTASGYVVLTLDTIPKSVSEAMAANLTPVVATALPASVQTVELKGADTAAARGVSVSGTTVTLTKAGAYRLTGVLAGTLVVSTGGVTDLVFDGVTITSTVPGAVVIEKKTPVTIHLADGSSNTVSDAGVNDAEDTDSPTGALFSHSDLVITGNGTLNVSSASGDALVSKDGLVIDSGTLNITAGDDGIRGKDYLVINGGTITVKATAKALKSNNTSAQEAGYILVTGGVVNATAGDDCLNTKTDVLISGGDLTLSCGDDGIHADQLLVIDGGKILITKSYEGLEAIAIHVAGGTIDLTASDDGINAAGSISTTTTTSSTTAPAAPAPAATAPAPAPTNAPGGPIPTDMPTGWPTAAPSGMPTDVPTAAPDAGPGAGRGGARPTAGNWPGGTVPSAGTVPGDWPGGGRQNGGGMGGGPGGGEGNGGQVLLISGGTLTVNAGGDGLDSNGVALMTGGTVTVFGPVNKGDGALDANAGFTITGGTLIALDANGMEQNPETSSSQLWFSTSFRSGVAANTTLTISSSDGKTVGKVTIPKNATNLVFSSPDLVKGQSYTVTDGSGTTLATATA